MFSVLSQIITALKGIVKTAMLAYQGYDAAAGDKKGLLKTHSREDLRAAVEKDNENEKESESEKESEKEEEHPGIIKRALFAVASFTIFPVASGIGAVYRKIEPVIDAVHKKLEPWIDKLGSPTACRIYSLVGAAFLMINPVSMPLGIAACAVSVCSIVVAAGIEAKRLYNLRILQKEEKMLNEYKGVNDTRKELIGKLFELRPDVARELVGVINLNPEIDPEYKGEVKKASWRDTIFKGVVGRVPENIACILSSVASLNPVSISFAVLGTTLNYGQNIRMQRAFDSEVVKLLKDVEMLKKDIKLVYQNSKGLELIKPAIDSRSADNAGLKAMLDYLEKHPDASINKCAEECNIATAEFERNNQFGLSRSFGDKTKEYFGCFRDVIIGGLSTENTHKMFAPRANNYEYYEQKLQEKKQSVASVEKEHVIQNDIVQKKEGNVPVIKENVGNMFTIGQDNNAQVPQETIGATVVTPSEDTSKMKGEVAKGAIDEQRIQQGIVQEKANTTTKLKTNVGVVSDKVSTKFAKEHHSSYGELIKQSKENARTSRVPAAGG